MNDSRDGVLMSGQALKKIWNWKKDSHMSANFSHFKIF